ncbi:helix-turn-helix domain-containing protein [Streptomyces sp. NPDC101115]|uniref:helix-turn-helix domain-containing protein n=1 Tax=Streptomyces sp. NPDC101115 TaxID=3366106 RepID=UPI003803E76D
MNRDPQAWARLGQALANARQAQGLTQEQLAVKAGVSLGSVQNAEAGQVPKARMPYTIRSVAKALGWPDAAVDDILDGGQPPEGWRDIPVQQQITAERLEEILTRAMVHASDNITGAEVKKATQEALDALRREGLI